jgi:1,4-alpha-glucan branching enzyme
VKAAQRDLNHLYRDIPALHELDFESAGFQWVDCHDADQSILVFLRRDKHGRAVICAFNFTPVPRDGYRIGCPEPGFWREIFNSDSSFYGGGNSGNGAGLMSEEKPWMGFQQSLVLTLPPLAGVILAQD